MTSRTQTMSEPVKARTGVAGFDEITGGGLPHGRTTLLVGGPGSGKTIFAVQFLVYGAEHCTEPGIFVAFEETPKRIVAILKRSVGTSRSCRRTNCSFSTLSPRPT